jgi:hypothetical protein
MVVLMRILPTLWLLSAATLANAQASASQSAQDALALARQSQHTLNEYSIGAMEPEAMKYSQRLRLTRAALDAQRKLWPAVASSDQPWAHYRACPGALETASRLAQLSGLKSVSAVDEQVFVAEKARLRELRLACDAAIRCAGLER